MSDAALAILTNIVLSVVSIVVSYIIHRLIMRSINRFTSTIGKEVKAPKTLSLLIAFLVYGFGIAAILSIWNIDLRTISCRSWYIRRCVRVGIPRTTHQFSIWYIGARH